MSGVQAWGTGPIQARLTIGGTTLTQEDILSLTHTAACCDGDIGFGAVCAATLRGTLAGAYSLLDEAVTAELGESVSGSVSWHDLGRFVVTECRRGEDSTTFAACDAAWYAAAGAYVPTVTGAVTVADVLADVADQCGLDVEQTTLNAGMSIPVSGALSGYTCREMLGFLAALCGRNCVISRGGAVRFVWFADAGAVVTPDESYAGAHTLGGTSRLSGLRCSVPDGDTERVLTAGNPDRAVELLCPLMTQSRLDALWNDLGGYTYPVLEVSFCGGAAVEPGELVTVTDRAGSSVSVPVMEVSLSVDGGCRCTIRSFGRGEGSRTSDGTGPVETRLNQAQGVAQRALLSANGKNKCFYQASAPAVSAGLTAGDLWFDTANGNRISAWDGSAWVLRPLGDAAVSNLDVGSITTGKLAAARIDVEDLFAQDITATGSITGARLTTGQNFNVDRSGILTARYAILQLAQLITALMSNASIEDVLRFKCWDVNPAYPEPEEAEEAEDVVTAEAETEPTTQYKEYVVYTEHEVLIIAKQDDEDTITPQEVTPPEPTEIARFYTDASNDGVVEIHHLNASGNLGVSGNLTTGSASIGGGNAVKGIWTGAKVVNPGGNKWVTLFTASEAASRFGYTPTSSNTLALVSNGDLDTSFSYLGICGGVQRDGTIVAELNRTINGLIRVNYMIVKIS